MQFITRWIESIVARIAAPEIAAAVARAKTDLDVRLALDAERFRCDEIARHIDLALVANNLDQDSLVDEVSSSLADSINPRDVAKYFTAKAVAEEIDTYEVARCIDTSDLDAADIAGEIDLSNLAKEIDHEDLAGHFCTSDVADSIDLDKLAGKLNYRLLAAALLEEVFHAKCEAQAAR